MSSAKSGQHKKQELRVKRLQAGHRKTYLFLESGTQHPEQEKTERDNMNGGEWKVTRAKRQQEVRKNKLKKTESNLKM